MLSPAVEINAGTEGATSTGCVGSIDIDSVPVDHG
jgi:hypothetical protein